ncbi:MAG: T9SS type A sorting domain-containing protein [Bacteroidota bacterium]|nr:MAG: T9SS type A sorting domain-containing protein [Bacteroidota bacterium]
MPNGTYVYPTDTTLYVASLSSANGCVDTASILANVLRSPLDSVSVSANYACSGSGFRLVAYTTGLYNYLFWSDPSGNTIAYNSPLDITPAVPGWYSATSGGVNGCSSIDSVLVLPDNGNQSAVSVLGQSDATLIQADGTTIRYTDENCNSIATIQDAPGGNSLGEVTATVNNLPSAGTYNGEAYVRKIYTITPTNQGPANVILYFSQADFDNYNANNGAAPDLPTGPGDAAGIANVRVTKVSGGALGIGTSSLIVPSSVIWNPTHSTWAVAFTVSSFSEFYLHSPNPSNGALPVEPISFTGKITGHTNHIEWMTGSEINNAGFELYRSNDGKAFAQLAKLATKALNGQSALPLQYEWVDAQPKTGHNYYKLKQMDIDGRVSESEVIDVYRSGDESIVRVYPNPTSAQIYVEWDSPKEENFEIQLLDMSGRIVQQIIVKAQEGMNTQVLQVESLSPGFYTLQRIQDKQVISVHKVKKQ